MKLQELFVRKKLAILDYAFGIAALFGVALAALIRDWATTGVFFLLVVSYCHTLFRQKGYEVRVETPVYAHDLWRVVSGEKEWFVLASSEQEVALLLEMQSEIPGDARVENKGKALSFS